MFEEFKALAYRKAVWQKLGEVLKDYFPEDLDQGHSDSYSITCEDVPYKDREVPREPIEDVLEEIEHIVKEAADGLASFTMVRRENERPETKKAQPVRSSSKGTRQKV
jgi:hypothetical protein